MRQDPIDELLAEHRSIMAQVRQLSRALEQLEDGGEAALPALLPAFEAAGRMMAGELELHRQKEDDVLFPALEAVFGVEGTPTVVMRQEHQEIHAQGVLLRQTLYELNEVQHPAIEAGGARLRQLAANGGSAQALQETGQEIVELLESHFSKEEDILFPMARNILEEAAWREIAEGFEQLAAGWNGASA